MSWEDANTLVARGIAVVLEQTETMMCIETHGLPLWPDTERSTCRHRVWKT